MALQNPGRPATARPVNEPPLSCGEADNPESTKPNSFPQAETTVIDAARQFRPVQARRRPVLTVQIGVRAANQPQRRSRPFSLSHDALDKLLADAAQLEGHT
jgi:hypothetical protein